MSSHASFDSLDDQALLRQFSELVRQDREGKANLLRHIDAIESRKLWARLGHTSLFDFLVTRHHMSEATAFKRIGAARTARRFPVLFSMIARGELHLSGIHRLTAHLTPENHEEVLAAAKHKTVRQIEELVAHLAPKPDVPSILRALPNPASTAPALTATSVAHSPAPAVPSDTAVVQPAPGLLTPRRDPEPTPLSPGRWKLQVTLSQRSYEKLKQLEDLLAHEIPNGDPARIVERALAALLKQVHKRKTGITARPRAAKTEAGTKLETELTPKGQRTRHVEAAVRREVWPRDDGRCGFVGEDGHRCNATRGLQFAHRQAWGKGGPNTASNLGLRCILCRMRHKMHYAEYAFMPHGRVLSSVGWAAFVAYAA